MASFTDRLKNSWNAFLGKSDRADDSFPSNYMLNTEVGVSSSYRPDRVRLTPGNERSIVTAVYNRIAIDVSAIAINHVRLDDNNRFLEIIDSKLNSALTLSANIDQTGRALLLDVVMSLFDEGSIAIVPTDTIRDPLVETSYDILELRVGKIVEWFPKHVRVSVYNENKGLREEILLPKDILAIIENPLYTIMNEPNSTLKRLIRKLNLLDVVDEQSGAGKIDLIVQLPYVIKSQARQQQAEQRRKDIEMQLSGSKYGIAYTDGTEKITQLNRPVDNNLMTQIQYLTSMLYSQLGLTEEIMQGTASEQAMLNYYNRTVEPIITAITDEMKRKFLTKTARSQHQSIMFFRDPFKLVPVTTVADIADKFTRNEILSSNEVRGLVGFKPVDDPRANELRNKNLNRSKEEVDPVSTEAGDIIQSRDDSDS